MDDHRIFDYWMGFLYKIPGLKLGKLIHHFKEPVFLYQAPVSEVKRFDLLTEKELGFFDKSRNLSALKERFKDLKESDIKFCTVKQESYPYSLKQIEDAPYTVFYQGRLPAKDSLKIAVIGSRSCSSYGSYCAQRIVKELVYNKVEIISGMAYGIDSLSQKTALKYGGYSLAVLGCGADICYPRTEIDLYRNLIEKGGILSEYPPGIKADSWHFPMRNRLISGISDAVLVIEAREKSGTMITVDRALEQGREVFAIPGRINDSLSYRCNWLIKEGAFMATSAKDILDVLGEKYKKITPCTDDKIKVCKMEKEIIGLESEEKLVYSIICFDDVCIDDIIHQVDLSLFKVNSICTKLVLKGLIREVGKGRFIRNA